MTDIFSKCGATCSRCLAYKANSSTTEERQWCSDGWHKYLGARLHPDRCYCDGCQTPNQALHRLLGEVGAAEGISYAEQAILQKQRRNLVKLLWTLGLYGEPAQEGDPHLVLGGETYLAQKIESNYSKLKGYQETLAEHGVHCEHVPLIEGGWRTPGGSLRKKGCLIKMSFGDEAGGTASLDALRGYAARLDEQHGQGALRRFSRADMRVLSKR